MNNVVGVFTAITIELEYIYTSFGVVFNRSNVTELVLVAIFLQI